MCQRGKRGHGARDADPRARLLDGHHPQRLAESLPNHVPRCRRSRPPSAGRSAGSVRSTGRSRCRPNSPRPPRAPPSTTSVDPPPRSTTTKGAAAVSNSPTAPRNDSPASSSPLITSATAPGTTAPSTSAVIAKNSSRLAASRVADVATIRTVRNIVAPQQFGVVGQRGPGRARSPQVRTGPWRRPPGPVARCASRGARRAARPSTASAISSRIELVPQSIAATLTRPHLPVQDPRHRRLDGQHRQRLVAEGIDAGALGQRVRDHHVQALHPVRHAAAGERRAQRLDRIALGQNDSCARRYAAASSAIVAEPFGHLAHQPRRLESARRRRQRRMRQVVQRRKRCSVRQSRRRLHHAGFAVGASVGDLEDTAGLAAQLPRDGVEIRLLNHRAAERLAAVAREARRVAAREEPAERRSGCCAAHRRSCATATCTTAGRPARPRFPAPARSAAPHPAAAAPGRGCRRASRSRAARAPGPRCNTGSPSLTFCCSRSAICARSLLLAGRQLAASRCAGAKYVRTGPAIVSVSTQTTAARIAARRAAEPNRCSDCCSAASAIDCRIESVTSVGSSGCGFGP